MRKILYAITVVVILPMAIAVIVFLGLALRVARSEDELRDSLFGRASIAAIASEQADLDFDNGIRRFVQVRKDANGKLCLASTSATLEELRHISPSSKSPDLDEYENPYSLARAFKAYADLYNNRIQVRATEGDTIKRSEASKSTS